MLVGGAAFVVEDLKVDVVTVFFKAVHDLVGSGEAVAVVLGLEVLNKDEAGVDVIGEHDVIVTAA